MKQEVSAIRSKMIASYLVWFYSILNNNNNNNNSLDLAREIKKKCRT